jgi:segregation and condensation protein B
MAENVDRQQDIKKKLEAMLFASGRKMTIEELSRLCRSRSDFVQKQLNELKLEYEKKDSSLLLMDENDGWKLTVKEQYTQFVQKIVAETELTKSLIETLAVIAWKAPVLQSQIIKVRTNKAYDHLSELETSGFISRERHGRTKMIKLTDKFYKYFDIKSKEAVKEQFKQFDSAANPPGPTTKIEFPSNVQSAQPVKEGESKDVPS